VRVYDMSTHCDRGDGSLLPVYRERHVHHQPFGDPGAVSALLQSTGRGIMRTGVCTIPTAAVALVLAGQKVPSQFADRRISFISIRGAYVALSWALPVDRVVVGDQRHELLTCLPGSPLALVVSCAECWAPSSPSMGIQGSLEISSACYSNPCRGMAGGGTRRSCLSLLLRAGFSLSAVRLFRLRAVFRRQGGRNGTARHDSHDTAEPDLCIDPPTPRWSFAVAGK